MHQVTIYPSCKATTTGKFCSSISVIEGIKSGKWKNLVDQLNAYQFDSKEQRSFKESMPAIVWQGTFSYRSSDNMLEHSGLVALDFDKIPTSEYQSIWDELTTLPYIWALFKSPRQNGIKAIVRIPPDQDNHSFYLSSLGNYMKKFKGYDHWDDLARLCYVSYDPNLYYNPSATEWSVIEYRPDSFDNAESVDKTPLPEYEYPIVFHKSIYCAEKTKGYVYEDDRKHKYVVKIFFSLLNAGLPMTNAIDLTFGYCSKIKINVKEPVPKENFIKCAKNIYTKHTNQFGTHKFRPSEAPLPKIKADDPEPKTEPKLSFPTDVFPMDIHNYITELNTCLNYSKDFLSVSMMWTLATINGNKYKLRVKNEWIAPSVFWFAIVGEPGTMKSHPINSIINPIKTIDYESKFAYDQLYAEYESNECKGTKPRYKQVLISDFTLEALHVIHDINRRGVGLYKDELIGFLNDMNRYRKGSDEQFWLESFNNKSYIVNRVTREPILIMDTMINIIGSIQPAVLSKLTKDYSGNGMVDRFLYTSNETGIYPISRQDINPDWKKWWTDMIKMINADLFYSTSDDTETIEMSEDATDLFIEIDKEFCAIQRSDTETNSMKNYVSKMKTYLPRFALLMWLFDIKFVQYHEQVERDHMERARRICHYFIASAREVFTESDLRKEIEDVSAKLNGKTKKEKVIALHEKGYRNMTISKLLSYAPANVSRDISNYEKAKGIT